MRPFLYFRWHCTEDWTVRYYCGAILLWCDITRGAILLDLWVGTLLEEEEEEHDVSRRHTKTSKPGHTPRRFLTSGITSFSLGYNSPNNKLKTPLRN